MTDQLAIDAPVPVGGLRDYQELAVEAIHGGLQAGRRRQYAELPTGTGKTRVMAEVARRFLDAGESVLAIAHRKELVHQLAEHMGRVTGYPAGVVMADKDELDRRLLAGSIQTLRSARRLNKLLEVNPPALVIVDEAHHGTKRNAYGAFLTACEKAGAAVVGCTATPFRSDGYQMTELFGSCAFVRSIGQMQRAGWLAPMDWRAVSIDGLNLAGLRMGVVDGDRDFATSDLAGRMNDDVIVDRVAAETGALLGDRTTLVFGVDVDHAQELAAAYRREGFVARCVWGAMPAADRAQVLADWRCGAVQVVTSVGVLTEGFDFPKIAALVMARPTMSPGLYLQMLGRGTRTAPGKADCLVLDVIGGANLIAAKQVTLDVVQGVEEDKTSARRFGDQSDSPAQRLLDPKGTAPWEWGTMEGGGFYTSITVDILALMLPDPAGSGMYWPALRAKDHATKKLRAKTVSEQALPLRDALGAIELNVQRNGVKVLMQKGQAWITREPSSEQMFLLHRLCSADFRQALAETWPRGRVALAITWHKDKSFIRGMQAWMQRGEHLLPDDDDA